MAPPPRLPPALMDDLVIDILLRLRPEDIACLTRASLVCKAWRRLLSDDTFRRRYREIHGAAPMLGFLYNDCSIGGSSPFFVPTTPASPFSPRASAGSPTCCRTLDCRHGRVLLHHPGYTSCLTIWNPVTGLQRCISAPVASVDLLMAAVLCASNGCDHLDCSDRPYKVVLLAKTSNHHLGMGVGVGVAQARASLYSSETHKWSVSARIELVSFRGAMPTPSLLAGDALFFMVGSGQVLKYDLTMGVLLVIWVPLYPGQNMTICTVENGGLGVATVDDGSLRLLSGRTDPDGATRWAQGRVIELDSMISNRLGGASTKIRVVGFAEGTGYIFVSANGSIFSVEVNSGRISKIANGEFGSIFPLMGFYIPGLQVPMRIE